MVLAEICQRGRSRCGPRQLHTASQGERNVLATREGAELLQCFVLDCRQVTERMDMVFMATHWITSAHRLSLETQQGWPQ